MRCGGSEGLRARKLKQTGDWQHRIYPDNTTARRVARQVARASGDQTYTYRCGRCGGFHWTRGTQ